MKAPHYVVIALVLLISGGLFYWYEWRPTQIRKQCSWVQGFDPAIEAKPAMTEEQLRQKGMLKDCNLKPVNADSWISQDYNAYIDRLIDQCNKENQVVIDEYRVARPAINRKEYWREAREKEYESCLRENGLE